MLEQRRPRIDDLWAERQTVRPREAEFYIRLGSGDGNLIEGSSWTIFNVLASPSTHREAYTYHHSPSFPTPQLPAG